MQMLLVRLFSRLVVGILLCLLNQEEEQEEEEEKEKNKKGPRPLFSFKFHPVLLGCLVAWLLVGLVGWRHGLMRHRLVFNSLFFPPSLLPPFPPSKARMTLNL